MSRYGVNSLLYRLKKDRVFRDRFLADAEAALAGIEAGEKTIPLAEIIAKYGLAD